jgi:hypothetical protein
MEGLSPTPKLFDELMRSWSGFTLTGEEADEGSNELKKSPKADESQELCKSIKDYIAQNPKFT